MRLRVLFVVAALSVVGMLAVGAPAYGEGRPVAGPIVVPLFTGVALAGTDSDSGCVAGVSEELIKAIRHDRENYYVNIHSTVFLAGAARGQLSK